MDQPRIVLGVSGGIAAYKAVTLLRLLTEAGNDVCVVPTAAALRFVGEPTWAALSGHPIFTDVWSETHLVPHVRLGQTADLVVVAPASADLMARAVQGRADDLLTATLLTATCPVVIVPAMHTEMWLHAATQDNVATLRRRGVIVVEPGVGRLTGSDSGPGRLPEPEELVPLLLAILARVHAGGLTQDLAGRRVVVSAGGTREYLDPVRFLGNRSSGRQGYALARAAVARGAEVTVVAANVALPDPAGAKLIRVGSAAELRVAVLEAGASADAIVMAAAVADFRPAVHSALKIKKRGAAEPDAVQLVRTVDVLAELGATPVTGRVLVGFAAETDDVLMNGRAKLAAKGADLLVVNEVGEGLGFEVADNAATLLGDDGSMVEIPRMSKDLLAHAVWDAVVTKWTVGKAG